jgi:peptide/nickel transport system ATP-binding protein
VTEPLLRIRDLSVDYITPEGPVRAVDRVSLDLRAGEILGIAGESGSGKTTMAKAILRILPPPAVITGGRVEFEGRNILELPESGLRDLRWSRISMVFQSAMDALNPVISIGEQINDTLFAKTDLGSRDARRRAEELMEMVDIPPEYLDRHAHQLSGGMRQRVGIALALALKPSLVILDEPTTALDVVVERDILGRIRTLQKELGFAVLFITHDLARMLQFSDRVAVFYAARVAEIGPAEELRTAPVHPYTQGLLRAFPTLRPGSIEPESIPGSPPSLIDPPTGCRFHPRCEKAIDRCRDQTPEASQLDASHEAWCHLVEDPKNK